MPVTTSPRRKHRTARDKIDIIELTLAWTLERAATTFSVSQATVKSWRAHEATFRQQDLTHSNTTNGEERIALRGEASAPPSNSCREPCEQSPITTAPPVSTASTPSHPMDPTVAPATPTSPQERLAPRKPTVLIGYAGLRGTVAEVAIESFSPLLQIGVERHTGRAIETVGYAHTIDAMNAVVRREIHYCVVPTSWLLSISASFALAEFASRPLCIVAEFFSKPPLCLSAVPGTELRDCRCVVSDAALLQAHEALILDMEAQGGEPIVRQATWDSAGVIRRMAKSRLEDATQILGQYN